MAGVRTLDLVGSRRSAGVPVPAEYKTLDKIVERGWTLRYAPKNPRLHVSGQGKPPTHQQISDLQHDRKGLEAAFALREQLGVARPFVTGLWLFFLGKDSAQRCHSRVLDSDILLVGGSRAPGTGLPLASRNTEEPRNGLRPVYAADLLALFKTGFTEPVDVRAWAKARLGWSQPTKQAPRSEAEKAESIEVD